MAGDNHELSGRVALITGSGRNIGRAIALQLAAGGAAVVGNARSNRQEADSVVREIEAAGGKAIAALGDVADRAADLRMAEAAVARFGRIDYLINNAAIRRESPIDAMSFDEWKEVLGVVLDGAFHCVQACLPYMRKSGAGAIVNIGGMSAHTGSKNRAHVTTAKAGLVGFTRGLAYDLAADNITVNYLSPGLIGTPRDPSKPEPQHHSTNRTLSGRRGTPDDVAAMVRFLCGPGARYISGQSLHTNGGAFLG
jgi:3-oxoacyl-[acyl-carrier protein] reductase